MYISIRSITSATVFYIVDITCIITVNILCAKLIFEVHVCIHKYK